MLIIALVLAVVSLAALVTAVVTSNEAIAWACIGFSALGVLLLIVDAIRDRHHRPPAPADLAVDRTEVIAPVGNAGVVESVAFDSDVIDRDVIDSDAEESPVEDFPDDEVADEEFAVGEEFPDGEVTDYPEIDELIEDHPEEVVYDEPDYDLPSDDEPVYPPAAEEAAVHIVSADDAESITQAHSDDSMTIIYAGEVYTGESGESSTLTESYVVINPDESDVVADGDGPDTVIYAEETAIYAEETADGSEERRESDSER